MARTGLAVGQVYRWTDDHGVNRELEIREVRDGFATCTVLKWRGRPKMRGMRVMLPDDHRFKLVQPK